MEAADGVRVLKSTVARRGCAPKYIRSDNGPEFVAKAMRERIAEKGFETLYIIKPGSPWQNAYSESFNSLMRDERLNVESFGILLEAKVLGKAWREAYNHQRLHSSLGYRTPEAFAQQCLQAACAPLRQPEGIASSQTTQEITLQTNPPARLRLSSKLAQTSGRSGPRRLPGHQQTCFRVDQKSRGLQAGCLVPGKGSKSSVAYRLRLISAPTGGLRLYVFCLLFPRSCLTELSENGVLNSASSPPHLCRSVSWSYALHLVHLQAQLRIQGPLDLLWVSRSPQQGLLT